MSFSSTQSSSPPPSSTSIGDSITNGNPSSSSGQRGEPGNSYLSSSNNLYNGISAENARRKNEADETTSSTFLNFSLNNSSSSNISSFSSTELSVYNPPVTNGVVPHIPPPLPEPLFKQNRYHNLVDGLPYVDPLNEEVEGQVKSLIEEEMKKIIDENGGQIKDYLSTLAIPPMSHLYDKQSAVGKEFLRCAAGDTMKKLDMSKYSSLEPPSSNLANDGNAWEKSVNDAHCLLEHSSTAIINLELMLHFAKDAWLKHLSRLEMHEKTARERVSKYREECEEVNKRRKLEQVSCGNTLRNLHREKEEYMQKNSSILSALGEMEAEIFELRKKCIRKEVLPEKYAARKRKLEEEDDHDIDSD